MQRLQQKIGEVFSVEEKIALLALVKELYLCDDVYRDIEQLSFDAGEDILLHTIPVEERERIAASIDPVEVFKDKSRQLTLLNILIDAAIIDGDANKNEADLIIKLCKKYGISLNEMHEAGSEDIGFFLQQGLVDTHTEFMALLDQAWLLKE